MKFHFMINSLVVLLSNCQVWGFIFQVFPVISGEPPVPIEFPSRLLLEDPVAAPCFLSDLQLIELNTEPSTHEGILHYHNCVLGTELQPIFTPKCLTDKEYKARYLLNKTTTDIRNQALALSALIQTKTIAVYLFYFFVTYTTLTLEVVI